MAGAGVVALARWRPRGERAGSLRRISPQTPLSSPNRASRANQARAWRVGARPRRSKASASGAQNRAAEGYFRSMMLFTSRSAASASGRGGAVRRARADEAAASAAGDVEEGLPALLVALGAALLLGAVLGLLGGLLGLAQALLEV